MDVIGRTYQRGNLVAVKLASQPFDFPTPAQTRYEQESLQSTLWRLISASMQMKFPLLAALLGLLLIPSPLLHARQTSSNSRQVKQEASRQSHTVRVTVAIDRTGRVVSATLAESSGSKDFDDAALAMLRKSAPPPKPPPNMEGDILNFTVPVTFTPRGSKALPLPERTAAPSPTDQARPDAGANMHSICRGC